MSATGHWAVYESPFGPLTLEGHRGGLRALRFQGRGGPLDERDREPASLAAASGQLEEFFSGSRRRFELALDLRGTPFQRAVWEHLLTIPYATTTTYGRVAEAIGRPDRVRAAAAAIGRTPVPIIVPCHRVVGADGALIGYGGGLHRKQALLDLERCVAAGVEPSSVWVHRQLALL
jgi:methylated-DNA-[protein]-cysteine S-methyltransferase